MPPPVIHLDRAQQAAFTGWSGEAINYAGLPAAASVDGEFWMVLNATGSRWLLNYKASGLYLSEGGAWKKINNAQLLLNDAQFAVYNTADNTKIISFDASEITTGTKRTYTWPDKDGIVSLTDSDGTLTLEGGLIFDGSVTEVINGNTNNLNVAGLSTTVLLRLDVTGNYDLTGLVPTDITKSQMIIVDNVGTGNLSVKNNSASSTAQNRFLFGGNITIQPNEGIIIVYDDIDQRWRSAGKNI